MGEVQETVHKKLKGQPTNEGSNEERTRTWVLTTQDEDRDGETVSPIGGDFKEYLRNPVVQWNHDTDSEPIGQMIGKPFNAYVGEGSDYPEISGPRRMALLGRIKFSNANPKADQVWKQILEGSIRAGSISFMPVGRTEKNESGGNFYPHWRLLEFTVCAVPANSSAIATNRKCLKNPDGTCKTSCPCKTVRKGMGYVAIVGGGATPYRVNYYDANDQITEREEYRTKQEAQAAAKRMAQKHGLSGFEDFSKNLKGTGSPAFKMGTDAWENSVARGDNPFAAGGHEWEDWNAGYDTADKPVEVSVKTKGYSIEVQGDGKFAVVNDATGNKYGIYTSQSEANRALADANAGKLPGKSYRKGRGMNRKLWTMQKGAKRFGWLLKAEGGIDAETEEYIAERGLDEVRIEESEPGSAEWVEEEAAEPVHQESKAGENFKPGDTVVISYGPYAGSTGTVVQGGTDTQKITVKIGNETLTIYANEVRHGKNTSGVPSGKTEEVADDVATRSAELVEQGVEEVDAVEAAMEEEGVAKGLRPAVRALVKNRKLKASPNVGDRVVLSGSNSRHEGKTGTVVSVGGSGDSTHRPAGSIVVEVEGGGQAVVSPSQVKPKRLRKNATPEELAAYAQGQKDAVEGITGFVEDKEKDEMAAIPGAEPVPPKSIGAIGSNARAVESRGSWRAYDGVRMLGDFASKEECEAWIAHQKSPKSKGIRMGSVVRTKNGNLCIVKDMDADKSNLTLVKVNGDEVEEKAKSVKLKSNDWGLSTKLGSSWGSQVAAKLTNWYGQLTGVLKSKAPHLKDVDLTGEEQKQVETEVEDAFMKAGEELGIEEKAEGYVQSTDDTTGKPASDADDSLVPMGKGLPHAQLKEWVLGHAASKSPKLQPTVAWRTWKLLKSVVKDATPEEAVELMCDKADDVTMPEEAKGIVGAAAKTVKEKWQKRFGACGKARCTKDWLCGKCCKKLTAKLKADAAETEEKADGDDEGVKNKDGDTITGETTISNEEGSPTTGGTDQLKRLLAKARGQVVGKGRKRIGRADDKFGVESGDEWGKPGKFVIVDSQGQARHDFGVFNSEGEANSELTRQKGTADEMTGDATQRDADAQQLSKADEEEVLEALSKRLDRLDGNLNGFAGAIYRKTLVKL